MNQVSGNIFDMLLGFDPVASGGPQPAGTIGATGGQSFDNILMSLLGGKQMSLPMGMSGSLLFEIPNEGNLSKAFAASINSGGDAALLVSGLLTEDTAHQLNSLSPGEDAGTTDFDPTVSLPKTISLPDFIDMGVRPKESLTEKTALSQGLHSRIPSMTVFPATSNASAQILSGIPVSESGIYNLVDARIEGDVVRLELQAGNDMMNHVEVSIPLKQAEQLFAAAGKAATGRVPISGVQAIPSQSSLDKLLQQVKLVELKVVDEKVAVQSTNTNVGGTNTGAIKSEATSISMISLTVDRRLMLSQSDSKAANESPMFSEESPDSGLLAGDKSQKLSMSGESRQDAISGRVNRMSTDVLDRLGAKPLTAEQVGSGLARDFTEVNIASSRHEIASNDSQSLSRALPVRFTLPDNLRSALRPNGEAVILRIEPDNLGPAKLQLEMHGGALRARVTVESTAARQAIEGSLDRLVDQLNQQNIRVDRIQVSVNTETGRHQHFDQPMYRQHIKKPHTNRIGSESDSGITSAAMAASRAIPTYVSASGINLYA